MIKEIRKEKPRFFSDMSLDRLHNKEYNEGVKTFAVFALGSSRRKNHEI